MIKDFMRWLYWYPFRYMIGLVSLKFSYKLARVASAAMYIFGSKKHAIRKELELISAGSECVDRFGDIDAVIKETLFNDFCKEFEVLKFPAMNSGNIDKFISCDGLAYVDEALKAGKGAILIFGHFGANQMVMPAMGYRGYAMNQIGAPPQVLKQTMGEEGMPPMLRKSLDLRWELEKTLPSEIINFQNSLRSAFKCLKRNEVLGFAIDGGAGENRTKFDFLGQEMSFAPGVIDVAMRTGAVLLPTFVVRDKNGAIRMIVEKPLEICSGATRDDELVNTAQAMLKKLEKYVYRYPSHYMSFLAFRRNVPVAAVGGQ